MQAGAQKWEGSGKAPCAGWSVAADPEELTAELLSQVGCSGPQPRAFGQGRRPGTGVWGPHLRLHGPSGEADSSGEGAGLLTAEGGEPGQVLVRSGPANPLGRQGRGRGTAGRALAHMGAHLTSTSRPRASSGQPGPRGSSFVSCARRERLGPAGALRGTGC